MERKEVMTILPAGPDNPLGRYAIETSVPGILIHETIKPPLVYQFRSHGCIRIRDEIIKKFFQKVEMNTPGEVIYISVKAAVSEKAEVFLRSPQSLLHIDKEFRRRGRKAA